MKKKLFIDSSGAGYYYSAEEVDAELERLQAESEGRRTVLLEKAEEARREWTRAENAEARVSELELAIINALNPGEKRALEILEAAFPEAKPRLRKGDK